ncbi:MAG: peptidylprolyl isomerase [Bacteroidota bacterium]
MKKTLILLTAVFICSFASLKSQSVKIEMQTDLGSIISELYPEQAPVTCENFIKYIQNNKFDSLHFYRVVRMDNQPNNKIKIEVIQGGLGFGTPKSRYPPIAHETTQKTGILHRDGVLSMARNKPGSASSEFFICIGDQPELDFGGQRNPDGQGFAAFGKVIEGMEVVKKIQNKSDKSQMLLDKVAIHSITILEE